MVIGGFWHGANWTCLLWGTLHGSVMALERAFGRDKTDPRLWPRGLNWLATMLVVVLGWVLFRAHDVGQAFNVYAGMRSEEHTSELQSLMRISYAVFCLKKKKTNASNNYRRIKNTRT